MSAVTIEVVAVIGIILAFSDIGDAVGFLSTVVLSTPSLGKSLIVYVNSLIAIAVLMIIEAVIFTRQARWASKDLVNRFRILRIDADCSIAVSLTAIIVTTILLMEATPPLPPSLRSMSRNYVIGSVITAVVLIAIRLLAPVFEKSLMRLLGFRVRQ